MHPEQIKAEIRMNGTTPAAIADSLDLSAQTVSNVIHGRTKSKRCAETIAKLIGKPVSKVWPGKYDAKRGTAMRRSRA